MKKEHLIKNFINTVKYRVELRTSFNQSPEKVLLEAFKYYDLKRTKMADFSFFKKVFTIKLGIL